MKALPTPLLCALALALLVPLQAEAQKEQLFGAGKTPTYREDNLDRRFLRSGLGRALSEGTTNPDCVQVLGGLFTMLGEVAPTLHKRDADFTVDPHLLAAFNAQLVTPAFPANAYLAAMVRRVMIDGKLPDAWLATAESVNASVSIIDLAKLRYLNQGARPIDSFYFTLPVLRERYDIEVKRATSAASSDVRTEFRDAYVDRDVAWGSAKLVDVGLTRSPSSRAKSTVPAPDEPEQLFAELRWTPPPPPQGEVVVFTPPKLAPVKLVVRLAPKQLLDLGKLPRGKRMLVKGRFWDMNEKISEVEIRDAILFEDRDWSRGALLAEPSAVARCPLAINELTGIAPVQPGGFGSGMRN